MIRLLRRRPRPDDLVSQQRRVTNRAGRAIYLALLGAFALLISNLLLGDLVMLRADGLVLRQRNAIDAAFVARVEAVTVKPGDVVAVGAPLFQLRSTAILDRLADLSARYADLVARSADFNIRAETVAELLPLASRRAEEAATTSARIDGLTDKQLLTAARQDEALRTVFDARQTLVSLQAQDRALNTELAALNDARANAAAALADLQLDYAAGQVAAPVSGTVGPVVPSPGEVFLPGETILSIYSGKAFVLAYLPRRYLFPIPVGKQVTVRNWRRSLTGEVVEILPVTDALPKEFQNTFKPADRSQLARIAIPDPVPFPLHEKVKISGGFPWF